MEAGFAKFSRVLTPMVIWAFQEGGVYIFLIFFLLADKRFILYMNWLQGTVERITCSYVTPALWTQEVNIISAAEKCENLTLKVRDSVREVVATYSIDEGSMELVVALPSNYPLGGLNVDSGKRVGVESGKICS